MEINDILKNQNYSSEYNLVTNSFIREYDLSKANINALLTRGVISKAEYDNLYNSDKDIREKSIGLMIRDNLNIYKEIQAGIRDAKYLLISSNNIDLEDIISIKNDAVFVKDNKLSFTRFGLMDFKLKNTYNIFMKIKKYEFYYYFNPYNNTEVLDVKGINDNKLKLHEKYFIDFLKALFNELHLNGIIPAVNMIQNFSRAYINRELDIGYYRKFNSESNYDLIYLDNLWSSDSIGYKDINLIDIRYNYEVIRDIYGILLSYYFKKVKE